MIYRAADRENIHVYEICRGFGPCGVRNDGDRAICLVDHIVMYRACLFFDSCHGSRFCLDACNLSIDLSCPLNGSVCLLTYDGRDFVIEALWLLAAMEYEPD